MAHWKNRYKPAAIDKKVHEKVKQYSEDSGMKMYKIYEKAIDEYLEKRNWKHKIIKK